MIKISGQFNTALCYTDSLDDTAYTQIQSVCNEEAFKESKIRIMPDVHAGKGCTIGTTKNMDEIVANIKPTAEIISHIKPIYNFKSST